MKNLLRFSLLLAAAALALPARAQTPVGRTLPFKGPTIPGRVPAGGVATLPTMAEIPAVKLFFDNIKEASVLNGLAMDVHLNISVSENAPVPDNLVAKGHWFTAFAEVVPFVKGAILEMNKAPLPIAYIFSDRSDNSYHNGGYWPATQPFLADKKEAGTIKFQYADTRGGEVTNVNLFTGWQGWTIKTAVQASGTMLYGTLENGDVFTMSYRLSPKDTGR